MSATAIAPATKVDDAMTIGVTPLEPGWVRSSCIRVGEGERNAEPRSVDLGRWRRTGWPAPCFTARHEDFDQIMSLLGMALVMAHQNSRSSR
jgi:hypothetical protein